MKVPYSCVASHAELLGRSVIDVEPSRGRQGGLGDEKAHDGSEEQPLLEPDNQPPQKRQRLEEDTDENEDDAPAQEMAGERVNEQAQIAKKKSKRTMPASTETPYRSDPTCTSSSSYPCRKMARVEPEGHAEAARTSLATSTPSPDPAKGSLGQDVTSLYIKHQRDLSKPAANAYTVHSKINLRSLEMQQRELEKKSKDPQEASEPASSDPAFDHTLILGHVSMLTDLLIGEYEGRRYILTSDRDEHIRVSRYIPQAYVIEAFCLGHEDFVNSLAVSETYPNLLISGGGDDSLFVWDWPSGRLLSEADLLSQVCLAADVKHVAVQRIRSSPSGIFVICEGVPAVFHWRLSSDDLVVSTSTEPKLVVAVDPSGAESGLSLLAYTLTGGDAWLLATNAFDELAGADTTLELSPTQIKSLLYTVESLRKRGPQIGEQAGEEGQ
ncbi:unnamed protein product [Parascedosporium putredinis]|uniref:Transfer RNA methyltransferase 82 n=1 Tax=Parascedosporium putredinis TaxID=1442378 RepID=A0A9P1MCE1_9PEZI|nr:unnamed protein product [Parascedosporium putredinis]CAI7998229.1 unnamed protein product [Parascedosporium putredinis]